MLTSQEIKSLLQTVVTAPVPSYAHAQQMRPTVEKFFALAKALETGVMAVLTEAEASAINEMRRVAATAAAKSASPSQHVAALSETP